MRQFGLLCFATFVFDTLDACTRLARYVLMELTGWTSKAGMVTATLLTLALPAIVVSLPPALVAGQEIPIWRAFWNLFGISNQLLAALALLGVTVWLHQKGKSLWFTLGPTIFMLIVTMWSLMLTGQTHFGRLKAGNVAAVHQIEFVVAVALFVMSVWIVVEAILLARGRSRPPADPLMPEPKAA